MASAANSDCPPGDLALAAAQYHYLLENIPNTTVAFLDKTLRLLTFGGQVPHLFGIAKDDIRGRSIRDILPQRAAEEQVAILQRAFDGLPASSELALNRRVFQNTVLPIFSDAGQVEYVALFSREVTEQKKAGMMLELSGDWLRTALSTTPVSIWEQDRNLCYRAVCNWLLDHSEEEVLGKRDVDIMPRREDGERLEALKRQVLESGVTAQHEVAVSNGEDEYFFELTIEPLYTESGEINGVVGVTYDVTARKAAEMAHERLLAALEEERARLQEMADNLEQRIEERTRQVRSLASDLTLAEQRERRRIAQVLHDELQQILVALQMGLHLTARDLEQQNGNNALRRLNELNDHVLEAFDITRTLTATLDSPSMNSELLADAFAWLAALMRDRYELTVRLDMDDCRLPNQDLRELIVSLTRELLFNVVKHAQVNEADLRLRADDDWLYIYIEDQGVGFNALEGLTAHASGGGFGLYSVRERLELFGGSLDIDSAPGDGTRIRLTVPRHGNFYASQK